jgi:DNA-binding transcriptional regulator YbjK
MATTSLTTPRPRGAARREALLEAALRIVGDVGADAVTHRRVAEEAGLPLASTTYWFESKEQLLTAALELAAQRDIARLRQFESDMIAVGSDSAHDPLEIALSAIIEPLDECAGATRGSLIATYALLIEAARRPAMRAVAQAWTEAYLDVLARQLARAGSSKPEADAELLLAATDGLLISQLASGETTDVRPQLRRLASRLLERP